MRRRGQEDQFDLVDDVLVGVEAGVLAIPGDIDARPDVSRLEVREVIVDPVLEGVGHGDELGAGVGLESLLGGAAAAAAAADQADLDGAAAAGVDHRYRQAGSRRGGGRCARQGGRRARKEFAPARWLGEAGETDGISRAGGLRSVSHGGAPVQGWEIRAGCDPSSSLRLHPC